jgi:hypothetical protein
MGNSFARRTFGPRFAYKYVIAHGGIPERRRKNMAKKAAKKLSKGKKIEPTKNLNSFYNRNAGR